MVRHAETTAANLDDSSVIYSYRTAIPELLYKNLVSEDNFSSSSVIVGLASERQHSWDRLVVGGEK